MKPGVGWRYLDRWSLLDTWANQDGLFFVGSEVGVSKNRGTPKSSILIEFSIINHLFWGTPIFGNTQVERITARVSMEVMGTR